MAACPYNLDVVEGLRYFLGIVNSLQGLADIIGNLFVFYIVLKNKRLRTRSNACLMSLAITDFAVGLILEPMHVMQFFSDSYRNNCGFNTVRRFLATLFMGASIGSIAVVSYDRYMHLSKTVNYRQHMSKRKIAFLLILSWLVPLIVPGFRFTSEAAYKIMIIIYIVSMLAIMITCYVVIIRIVKKRENVLKSANNFDKSKAMEIKSHIRAAKAIALIIAIFLLSYAPLAFYHAITAISSFSSSSSIISASARETGYAVLMTIGMANSAVNPVIYYLRIPEFKKSFKRYLKFLFPMLRETVSNDSRSDIKDIATTATQL